MNFHFEGIKKETPRGGVCRWSRNVSKFFHMFFRHVFVFIYLKSCLKWKSVDEKHLTGLSYTLCIITAMEYFSKNPKEKTEHMLC